MITSNPWTDFYDFFLQVLDLPVLFKTTRVFSKKRIFSKKSHPLYFENAQTYALFYQEYDRNSGGYHGKV